MLKGTSFSAAAVLPVRVSVKVMLPPFSATEVGDTETEINAGQVTPNAGAPMTFTVAPPLAAASAAELACSIFNVPAVSSTSIVLPAALRLFPVMLAQSVAGPPAVSGLAVLWIAPQRRLIIGQRGRAAQHDRTIARVEGTHRDGEALRRADVHVADRVAASAGGQQRGEGIGSSLLKGILAEGAQSGKPVTIHVEPFN